MYYLLYNPISSNGKSIKKVNKVYKKISRKSSCYRISLLEIENKERSLLRTLTADDIIVLFGGDGTINQFANRINGEEFSCKILFYSTGDGNDFIRDYNKKKFLDISSIISDFPKMRINDSESYVFANGVGIGIDGYVCRIKNQYKFSQIKKSYFSITRECIKTFRPYSLDVLVDGRHKHYDNVWFFVCNHGRHIGGGMKVVPNAIRNDEYLDVCIIHSLSVKKILFLFPLIYLGLHVFYKKYVDTFRCQKFTAIPDGCNVLQADAEVLDYVGKVEVER